MSNITSSQLRRGTRVTYTYAAGAIVSGKVLRPYAPDMPGWFLVELRDDAGTYQGGCHRDQITVTDNRPGYGWAQ